MSSNLPSNLKWLLFSRIVIATFLFGIAAFVEFRWTDALLSSSLRAVYYIIAATYFSSIAVILILKKLPQYRKSIYTLPLIDLFLVTFLIHYTGGAESIYSILYSLVVIYSALIAGRRGGNMAAGIGGLLYGIILGLEYFGIVPTIDIYREYTLSFRQVLARFFINAASLFVISFLSSFVSDQEKKLRALLAEKEDAFKELDLLYRHIIESVDAGVLTFDLKGRIKSFNRAASDITGRTDLEVLDKNIFDLFPELKVALSQGKGQRSEMVISRKESKKAVIGFSISPLMNYKNEKIGEIMIFQDVTSIREMEQQIEKTKKMALIGEMAAGLAHEMRNPLAAMGGSIQVLRRDLKLSETDERLMQIILRGKEQLDVFLRDFLMLARPGSSEREEIDTDHIIRDILDSLRFGQDWNEHIEIVHKKAEMGPIYGNPQEVRQALMNIILNAIQSMQEGGVLTIEPSRASLNGTAFLNISVRDTGCGIGPENMEKIFEPFYTTKDRGTGLGLAIVGRVLESHGGRISVESAPGAGTRIVMSFPVSKENSPG